MGIAALITIGLLGTPAYPWPHARGDSTLSGRIAPPDGYVRVTAAPDGFGAWLRGLPLEDGHPDVLLFNGKKKANQRAHHAVVDIDVGSKDLQQCADAVMRLRAEYLYATGQTDDICFRFTSGDENSWKRWAAGDRPRVKGNEVSFRKKAADADDSYASFRKYLDNVFVWAGTWSLSKELAKVDAPAEVEIGDVFIRGGFPGHAVLVADVAENEKGERVFLLLQSYMPAQSIHVLRNPSDSGLSPWYRAADAGKLETPEWTFDRSDLKRFQDRGCP